MPPEYANRAAYEGPMPNEGVSGLPGTKVQVFLRSNRPLRRRNPSRAGRARASPPSSPMKPAEPGGQEVVGQFSIAGDGKFECRVIDEAGQASQQSFSGNVVLLADERPLVRHHATAEDVAGHAHRGLAGDALGGGRLRDFAAATVPQPERLAPAAGRSGPAVAAAAALEQSVRLPLEHYGLAPGDVIKLFGRVEDNDPARRKGAESSMVTVRIISQEEFERMVRAKEGVQAMLSKYYAARRRMESAAAQVEGLRKKLQKLRARREAIRETRAGTSAAQRLIRREAGAIRKSAGHLTSYDLDKYLAPQLRMLVTLTDEMANALEKLQQDRDLINARLAGKLDELAKRLASGRRSFEQQAAEPLEYFEAVFPLLADQQRFVMLVLWQQRFCRAAGVAEGPGRPGQPRAEGAHARPGGGAGADPRNLGQASRRHPGARRETPRESQIGNAAADGGEVR